MKLNHTTLTAVGTALYGNQWQQALADDLGVNVRTLRRWAKNEFSIPNGVWDELSPLCQSRAADLFHLAGELRKAPRLE